MLMGTSFLAQNANKKSVTLNLKTPEGKEVFKKLVAKADVVVENFRPDVMTRLGLGYPVLADDQPAARLLRHLRLRPDRARRREARLRPDHPGPLGRHGRERRRAAAPAARRLPRLRHGRRPERGLRDPGRPLPPREDGRGPDDRRGPPRLDHAPHGLGGGEPADRRPGAGPDGQRQLHRRALGNLRDPGRPHQHRREQAGAVGGAGRGARRPGAQGRPPLPGARRAEEEPQGADAAPRGEAEAEADRPLGRGPQRPRRPVGRHPLARRPPSSSRRRGTARCCTRSRWTRSAR